MIEVENLEEYRPLLQERRNAPLQHRIKHACNRQTAEIKIIAAVLVCFTIGVTFIALKKSSTDSGSTETILKTDEEVLWHYNNNEEREVFLRLWNNANETLLPMMESYGKSANEKDDDRSKLYAHCELILETVKRSLKHCVSLEILPNKCKKLLSMKFKCKKDGIRYRNWDGSCNNLQHSDWGMTGDKFDRWLRATYTDDVSIPRQSVYGGELPPVRYLSNLLFSHKTLPDSNATTLFTQFGLFLDHDMVLPDIINGNELSCCETDPKKCNPSCMKIDIPQDDPFYGPLNVTCKGFFRSPPFTGTCPGLREQQNRMTSYIDSSSMYGPSHEEARILRVGKKGLMRYSTIHHSTFLPKSKDSGNACYTEHANNSCFLSGDFRANMIMPLMAIHTIWLREHNRIASELSQINPKWDDETLYQETRKITIAEYQHIIYKEYLPIIFGYEKMKEFGLIIEEDKPYNGYDINVNAGIRNAFASAAFRFGHALVQSKVQLRDENYNVKDEMPLHDTYLNPNVLYDGGYDDAVRGMVGQKAQESDHYTTEEIRGRLFQSLNLTNGNDLTAMSILRGRDHGIPPYLKWREFCKLPVPNSWEDMKNFMKKDYVETLKEAYRSIEDIDLIPGGLGEQHVEGALVGPTYICLIGKQFSHSRKGDRFWYENLNHAGAFTKDQLKEIYKISHARIICDNSDNILKIPKNPFFTISDENPILDCDDVPKLDLNLWKEM
ncbi:unnamed protein product [Larinioides sclopetarius]|uniref:Peroxidase n=1 Tax=Larinioides sclopetarius TaxID=280406 RepID=A0AAV1ZUE2_9ARAC